MENLEGEQELLIVEDDEDFVALILKHLQGKGVAFDCARTVDQAKEFLAQKKYKAISLDVFLGKENCGEILRYLKDNQKNENNQAKVVICSAFANADFMARMADKGYTVFSKQSQSEAFFQYLSQLVEKDIKEEFSKALDELLF
ncbi:MAG: hypothetical protein A2X86_13150 [Bdellovibrionales bacterium GWA2_49_15]|nr:MAG: hypothetical protein A2X86_13150 [Bdellovibrionales bacterium GWA2_49_15]HAZ13470.1 hypothetical protein [Bdellovibrionales bacterium]